MERLGIATWPAEPARAPTRSLSQVLIFRHSRAAERAVNRLRRFLPSSSAWLPLSSPPMQTFSGLLFRSTNLLQEAAKIKSKKFRYLCIEFRQNKALAQTRQVIYDGVSEISKL